MYTIPELKQEIDRVLNETYHWITEHEETALNKRMYADKWTALGHIYHLIKSTKAVSQALKKPKFILRFAFGKNNREERTFTQTKDKYYSLLNGTNIKAPKSFSAEPTRTFSKAEILARLNHEFDLLISVLDKWNENDLTTHILPHPALGKMTIREILYFTIFHTEHHLTILKRDYQMEKRRKC